jgi:hypothetical protein
VYLTALAVTEGDAAAGWSLYVRWLTACWQGRVAQVLDGLRGWRERLGAPAPGPGPPEADGREVLRRTLGYLTNNAARMDYPRYRPGQAHQTSDGATSDSRLVFNPATGGHLSRPGGSATHSRAVRHG